MRTLRTVIAAFLIAVAGTAAAQAPATLAGQVIESFGLRFILQDDLRLVLVTLTEAKLTPPEVGDRVRVTGTRDGNTFDARTLEHLDPITTNTPIDEATLLPPLLTGLGLRDVWRRDDRDGATSITATLPDGTWIAISLDGDGTAGEVEVETRTGIPPALIERLLPKRLLSNDLMRTATAIISIEREEDELEILLLDASGAWVEIEANTDGAVLEFERETDDEHERPRLPREALIDRLRSWGYVTLQRWQEHPDFTEVQATNPYGERVLLRIDPEGRVTQERILWDHAD